MKGFAILSEVNVRLWILVGIHTTRAQIARRIITYSDAEL